MTAPVIIEWLPSQTTPSARQTELDQYVLSHPAGSLYHLSAWRLAVQAAYGHAGGALVALQGRQIVGLLPWCQMQFLGFNAKQVAVPFADYCDILADSDEVQAQLLATAMKQLENGKAKRLQLRVRTAATDEPAPDTATKPDANSNQAQKVCMQVALPASSELLLASYKPKLRSQIKKAGKNGLTAELADTVTALHEFYAIYCQNMHRLGSPVHRLQWFEQLLRNLPRGACYRIALVRSEGVAIGAGLVFYFANKAWIPWASTLARYNHLAPNMLLYWQIQAHLADHGVTCFDMGRSTPGEGTYRFKQQWGAKPVALHWPSYTAQGLVQLPAQSAQNGRLRPAIEAIWRKLPLAVATRLGAAVRGYISL